MRFKDEWQPCFAWLPVHTLSGRWLWLQKVERRSRWNGCVLYGDMVNDYRLPLISLTPLKDL